jgi:hypothetical protein
MNVICLLFLVLNFIKNEEDVIMIVNFLRHGSRTPGKMFPEIKNLFHKMNP